MIKLGAKVKDTITGFTGIAVARTEWLNGCIRLGIQGQALKDGLPQDVQTFDAAQVQLVEPTSVPVQPRTTGGPMPAPKRNPDPARF